LGEFAELALTPLGISGCLGPYILSKNVSRSFISEKGPVSKGLVACSVIWRFFARTSPWNDIAGHVLYMSNVLGEKEKVGIEERACLVVGRHLETSSR
jgi:hypothetical protein